MYSISPILRRPARTAASALAAVSLAACANDVAAPSQAPASPTSLHFTVLPLPAYLPCGGETPVTVQVADSLGNPAAGVLVNFRATTPGGSFYAGSGLTTAAGTVKDYWTVGTQPNTPQIFEARGVDQVSGAKLNFATDTVTTQTAVAFASTRDGNWEIYLANAGGSAPVRLTNDAAADIQPAWSPDGKKLAFVSRRDGNYEIYTMNPDGTGLLRLTNDPSDDVEPSWSPDGSRIAFSTHRNARWDVYTMNPDGTGLGKESGYNAPYNGQPTWGVIWNIIGEGTPYLVYVSDFYGNREIVTNKGANLHGPVRLTNTPAEEADPEFTADGSRLAFASMRDGNWEVYTATATGANPVRITNNAASDRAPTWSPDGGSIAFMSLRTGKSEIFAMSPTGTDVRPLTVNTVSEDAPTWSACVAH
jgi:Tol biopolymer transport system component